MQTRINPNLKTVFYALIVITIGVVYCIYSAYRKSFFLELFWIGYAFIFIDWGMSVKRKFTNKNIIKNLTASCFMAVLLLFLNYYKYNFIYEMDYENVLLKLLWYAYYVPILLMPQFMFIAALYIGKTEDEKISKRWNLLYVLSAALIIAVLTNDYHGLVFRLHYVDGQWDGSYGYGALYYVIFTLISLYVIALLFLIFRHYSNRRFIRRMWLPCLVIVIGLIYLICYIWGLLGHKNYFEMLIHLPVFFCLAAMMYWDSVLKAHLLPSNDDHARFFMASNLQAGICDSAFKPVLTSDKGEAYVPELLKNAVSAPLNIDENTVLKSNKINGGYFYYTENIGAMNAINRDLLEKENYLEEENAVLAASNKLREDSKRYAEQNLIYDRIAKSVKPQCDKIERLLSESDKNDEAFNASMKQIGIIGAYIKRYGNMLLLSAENEFLGTEELKYAVDESVNYARLAGIEASADIPSGITLPSQQLLFLYELFEASIEAALPSLSKYDCTLQFDSGHGVFRLSLTAPAALLPYDFTDSHGAAIRVDSRGGTETVSCRFFTGGDGI